MNRIRLLTLLLLLAPQIGQSASLGSVSQYLKAVKQIELKIKNVLKQEMPNLLKNQKILFDVIVKVNKAKFLKKYLVHNSNNGLSKDLPFLPGLSVLTNKKQSYIDSKSVGIDDILSYLKSVNVSGIISDGIDLKKINKIIKLIVSSNFPNIPKTKIQVNLKADQLLDFSTIKIETPPVITEKEKIDTPKTLPASSHEKGSIFDMKFFLGIFLLGAFFIGIALILARALNSSGTSIAMAIKEQELLPPALPQNQIPLQKQSSEKSHQSKGDEHIERLNSTNITFESELRKIYSYLENDLKLTSEIVEFVSKIEDYFSLAIIINSAPVENRKSIFDYIPKIQLDSFKGFLQNQGTHFFANDPKFLEKATMLGEVFRLYSIAQIPFHHFYLDNSVKPMKYQKLNTLLSILSNRELAYVVRKADPLHLSYSLFTTKIKIDMLDLDAEIVLSEEESIQLIRKIYAVSNHQDIDQDDLGNFFKKLSPYLHPENEKDSCDEGQIETTFDKLAINHLDFVSKFICSEEIGEITSFVNLFENPFRERLLEALPPFVSDRVKLRRSEPTLKSFALKAQMYYELSEKDQLNSSPGKVFDVA